MSLYSKESLEHLRQKIDLVEVLAPYVDLKKGGAFYKALCPFHEEKTPSFSVHKGDRYYHCFGCGAHGDAIQFLMTYLRFSFKEACEHLAHRFSVVLQRLEPENRGEEEKYFKIKGALNEAVRFYRTFLLHAEEGREAVAYLHKREIGLEFMETFSLGLAPKKQGLFSQYMKEKGFSSAILEEAGLIHSEGREFFLERILFPIFHPSGYPMGFSARKYREETFGGKYVNTKETLLFKKSRVLFGLNWSRRTIAKEGKVLIVEGQIDALRLIFQGLDWVVASQGTAFGEAHVQELVHLGVKTVYLAFDADLAGRKAALKVGDLFQSEGIEVKIVRLPPTFDPDLYMKERGKEAFLATLECSEGYLAFCIEEALEEIRLQGLDSEIPAIKNDMVETLAKQIRRWRHPVMVHESLRWLAHTLQVPEEFLGVSSTRFSGVYMQRRASVEQFALNPDQILEEEFLGWFFLAGKEASTLFAYAKEHIPLSLLKIPLYRTIYQKMLDESEMVWDAFWLCTALPSEAQEEGEQWLSRMFQEPYHKEKVATSFQELIQKLLIRHWMEEREKIKNQIQSGRLSDDEVEHLTQLFNTLCKEKPVLKSSLAIATTGG